MIQKILTNTLGSILISILALSTCLGFKKKNHSNTIIENLTHVFDPQENTGYLLQFYGAGLHDVSKFSVCDNYDIYKYQVNIGTEIFSKKDKEDIEYPGKYGNPSGEDHKNCISKSYIQGFRFLLGSNMHVAEIPTFIYTNEFDDIIYHHEFKLCWDAFDRGKPDPTNGKTDYYDRISEWVNSLPDKRVTNSTDIQYANNSSFHYNYSNRFWLWENNIHENVSTIYFEKSGSDENGSILYKIYTSQNSTKQYLTLSFMADSKANNISGIRSDNLENATTYTNANFQQLLPERYFIVGNKSGENAGQIWKVTKIKTQFGDLIAFQEQSSKKYLRVSGCSFFTLLK